MKYLFSSDRNVFRVVKIRGKWKETITVTGPRYLDFDVLPGQSQVTLARHYEPWLWRSGRRAGGEAVCLLGGATPMGSKRRPGLRINSGASRDLELKWMKNIETQLFVNWPWQYSSSYCLLSTFIAVFDNQPCHAYKLCYSQTQSFWIDLLKYSFVHAELRRFLIKWIKILFIYRSRATTSVKMKLILK